MTNAAPLVALMAANPLPELAEGADAPEWVHILPAANGSLQTNDGRGPYYVRNPQAIIEASMAEGDIPVDQDHAIGKLGKHGGEAPARGWITAMETRDDGIWAKVRWTSEGRELVASQAYRKLSPVIRYRLNGEIIAVREVSLVNRANLRGLVALNNEGSDMLLEELIKLLGLEEGATEEQALEALKALKEAGTNSGDDAENTALQTTMDEIAGIIGLEAGASAQSIKTAATALKTSAATGADQLIAMQTQLDGLVGDNKRDKAVAFVDKAIGDGHMIPATDREEYISMHMEMPDRAEKIMTGLPKLGRTHTNDPPPKGAAGKAGLSAQEAQVAAMMGQDPAEYAKLRDALGEKEEAL